MKCYECNERNETTKTAPKGRSTGAEGALSLTEESIRKLIQSELGMALHEELKKILGSLPLLIRESLIPDSGPAEEDETLDDPMEIDFVQKKEPKTSIASVRCKIKRLKIPAMALDSGAEIPIITEDIVIRVKGEIDKTIKHDLSGIATAPTESIGLVHNLPITLAPGCTIHEDFVVVKYPKPMLIFSNSLLKKYKCAIDWDKNELKIHHNGKDLVIPVTMHKVKNKIEVNCASIAPLVFLQEQADKSSTIPDCISQDLERKQSEQDEDDILKKT